MHPRPSLPFGRHGEDARPLCPIKKEKISGSKKAMNLKLTIIISIIQISICYGQSDLEVREYEYIDHSYEKITLKKDSFNYIYNVGLSKTDVDGTIKYRNDTLIFNSEFQADKYSIIEKYNPDLKKNEFEIIIIDTIFRNQISLFATRKFHKKKKEIIEPTEEFLDTITFKSTNRYILNQRKFPKKKGAIVRVWRKNFFKELKFKDKDSNSITIEFLEYPFSLDYIFFKDVEAVEENGNLIFLGDDNNLIEVKFNLEYRRKRFQKKKELKIYRASKKEEK
jgi:hypothetical protein